MVVPLTPEGQVQVLLRENKRLIADKNKLFHELQALRRLAEPEVYCTCNRHLHYPEEGCKLHGPSTPRSRAEAEALVDRYLRACVRHGCEWTDATMKERDDAYAALLAALTGGTDA